MINKKNSKYIVRMVIYLVIIIIAILTAIIGTLIINDKRDERIKDMVDQIIVEIETDGSDLDSCKEQLEDLYGYNADDYVAIGVEACENEKVYREVKTWMRNNQSWNNGRILMKLCDMLYYKDCYDLLSSEFNRMKKDKNLNIDVYGIISDKANQYYENHEYNESSDLSDLLNNYKDSKKKYINGRQNLMNQR